MGVLQREIRLIGDNPPDDADRLRRCCRISANASYDDVTPAALTWQTANLTVATIMPEMAAATKSGTVANSACGYAAD